MDTLCWRNARSASNEKADAAEKIQYRKCFDRRPYLTATADKFGVREYASRIPGEDLTPEIYYR